MEKAPEKRGNVISLQNISTKLLLIDLLHRVPSQKDYMIAFEEIVPTERWKMERKPKWRAVGDLAKRNKNKNHFIK
jgi:hypothetical protein